MAEPRRFADRVSMGLIDGGPAVDCDADVLEKVRMAVVDALHKIPHGGIEVGGLLLGQRDHERVKIIDWQPIGCEHALGPSFTLSQTDEAALSELIEAAVGQGLEVVGWFHSHTRSDLHFTEKDQKLHERFFPELWQVALLLRPAMLKPTRAAIFRRRSDGSWDLQPEEFLLEPPPPEQDDMSIAPVGGRMPSQEVMRRNVTVVPMQGLEPAAMAPPFHRRSTSLKAVAAALALIAVAIAGMLAWRLMSPQPVPAMGLSLQDSAGLVRISWNPRSPAFEAMEGGKLVIKDGAASVEQKLSTQELRRGSIDYLRNHETMQVGLTVLRTAGKTYEEWTSFIAPRPQSQTEADRAEPNEKAVASDPPVASTPIPEAKPAPAGGDAELLRVQEARIRAELERLEQAKLKAEQEQAASARAQAERERLLQRMAEENKAQLAKLEQLRAAARLEAAAAPHISVSSPVQPPAVPLPDLSKSTAPPAAAEQGPRYTGPTSGRVIWTGVLPKNATLSIDDARTSSGSITGRLPRVPVRTRAYPAELSNEGITIYTSDPRHARGSYEPASRHNGWNATTYKFDPSRASELTLLEAPDARNEWRKVVVRNDDRKLSMIVLEWDVLRSAKGAARATN